ncbi:hypothetical protein FOIG_13409 [Fusarium odoratissimum NRRL 54006]|uniref:Uncharacterized protein n=1 Tax=Fusarium odoratissimum (strain NRRL 54006) TaxID=1089451 RepID=X0K977_FUSO5|nr:uncharacterized protein FOIG_13409 [Fusarium odoratissimum NRRL 54006]EXL93559.1 hypothetical protein FOIG_13409 [Fusarium odoratissimum NRRL 54006]
MEQIHSKTVEYVSLDSSWYCISKRSPSFLLSLDGQEATSQSLMLRYGTIIAFCAKASLGTAVAMAFQQRAWLIARHKMARLETVDAVFTANNDIFSLLTWSSLKNSKIGTLLALYCWITPLVVVLTAETLAVVAGVTEELVSCPSVRTLNFDNEANYDCRERPVINGRTLRSVAHFNTTSRETKPKDFNLTHFDYWNAASTMYRSVVSNKAVFMREPLVRDESAEEVCSDGWNCTYVVEFLAPGYKYEEVASGVGSKPRPKDLDVFKNEPIIWIGYSTVKNINEQQPKNKEEKGWDIAYTAVIFGCEHYQVNYTVRFDYVRGAQSYKIKKREYVRKVVNTTPVSENTPGKTSKKISVPESNWVHPQDFKEYCRTAVYHVIGNGLRRYVGGSVNTATNKTTTYILLTSLGAKINPLPITDLHQGIQKLYEDLVMSLFSEPSFVAVAWASNGKPSGTGKGDASTRYPCRQQRQTTLFVCKQVQLLCVYAASILLAVIGVLVGIQAYREAGVMLNMKPSSIVGASKNGALGAESGDARTGYGLVQDRAETNLRAPGREGNISQQRRL